MKLKICNDPSSLNRILNHKAVHPWICGPLAQYLDITPVMEDPKNIVLMTPNKEGAFLCVDLGRGVYEVHTQFTPEGRGSALEAALAGERYMFSNTKCIELITQVPKNNRSARALTLKSGFKYVKTEGTWPYKGKDFPMDVYNLTKAEYNK